MIDETTPRFFITGITKDNEQSVINKLERSGFTNWWGLSEDTASSIYVSRAWNNKYLRVIGGRVNGFSIPEINAKEYLCEEVSK